MPHTRTKHRLNTQVLEEASAWFIDFEAGDVDAAGREEFNRWLRTSPEHVRAYLQVSTLWEDTPRLRGKQTGAETLVERALADANVVPLGAAPARREPDKPSRRRFTPAALAAAAAGVCLFAGALAWLQSRPPIYATEVGEQRSVTLPDGSRVELNSRSRVKVSFSAAERRIELLAGQALFDVAKDAARPFVVRSGRTDIEALGTQFDVYRRRDTTIVTVVEGKVSAESVVLTAGARLVIDRSTVSRPTQTDPLAATAWTQHKLIFESTPLPEVIEEFNRYNVRQLVLADPALASFHVSGVFTSTDPGRLVQFLRQRFDIEVRESNDEIRIARR